MMNLFMQGAIILALLTLLILVNLKLTLIVGLTLGLAYLIIYKFSQFYITRIGQERFKLIKHDLLL